MGDHWGDLKKEEQGEKEVRRKEGNKIEKRWNKKKKMFFLKKERKKERKKEIKT